jgi:hypothetical protein
MREGAQTGTITTKIPGDEPDSACAPLPPPTMVLIDG